MFFRWFFLYFLAFTLEIVSLPTWLCHVRPPWVLLFFIYRLLETSHRFSLIVLFFSGILLDLLQPTLLGQHAFALIFVLGVLNVRVPRFASYATPQKIFIIFCACFCYFFLLGMIDIYLGLHPDFLLYFPAALTGALLWPFITHCYSQGFKKHAMM